MRSVRRVIRFFVCYFRRGSLPALLAGIVILLLEARLSAALSRGALQAWVHAPVGLGGLGVQGASLIAMTVGKSILERTKSDRKRMLAGVTFWLGMAVAVAYIFSTGSSQLRGQQPGTSSEPHPPTMFRLGGPKGANLPAQLLYHW